MPGYESDDATPELEGGNESDNDQTMTGMMSAARIGEDADVDEELEEGAPTATNTPLPHTPVQPN